MNKKLDAVLPFTDGYTDTSIGYHLSISCTNTILYSHSICEYISRSMTRHPTSDSLARGITQDSIRGN